MRLRSKLAVVADALWVASFLTSWGLLNALWDTRWAAFTVPLFVCHLGGLSEFVHQTVHQNLFARNRGWNRSLGKVAAALLSVDFDTYRTFHLQHHRAVNTPDDPELPLYKDPAYLAIADGWSSLSLRQRLGRILPLARYIAEALASFGGNLPFVRTVRWSVPVIIALSGFIEGLPWYLIPAKLIVTWYLPLLVLLFIDIVFAQSEHYGTAEIRHDDAHSTVPVDVQYAHSWNLKVPKFMEFLLLKRNIHAEHHLLPSIHWTRARDQGTGRSLPFWNYMRMLWTKGPRIP